MAIASLLTKNFGLYSAQAFVESFSSLKDDNITFKNNTYFFIGKVSQWADQDGDSVADEAADITTPLNTRTQQLVIWDGMIGAKRVQPSDVRLVISKHQWDTSKNTIYAEYSDTDSSLFLHPTASESVNGKNAIGGPSGIQYDAGSFYVLTDNNNVYKCLQTGRNSDGIKIKSTVKPTSSTPIPFRTLDSSACTYNPDSTTDNKIGGYLWKYMYTISSGDMNKFVDTEFSGWIPIRLVDPSIPGDYETQLIVQNTAVDGKVNVVRVQNVTTNGPWLKGSVSIADSVDYDTRYRLTESNGGISGNGSGLVVDLYVNPAGKIYFADVVSGGQDYSTVTITPGSAQYIDKNGNLDTGIILTPDSSGSFTDVTLKIEISPQGGHGFDAPAELGATRAMLAVKLDSDENSTLPITNDYRKFGLIHDPRLFGSTNIATGANYDQTLTLNITKTSGVFVAASYVNDEIIYISGDSTITGRVVSFTVNDSAATGVLKLVNVEGTFATTETILGATGGVTATINSIVQPAMAENSGKVMYIEHRQPITRNTDQTESFKMIFEF